jgi:hypothetical protein
VVLVLYHKSDRLLKSSKYIPKRLLKRIQEMKREKTAVKEILQVLRAKTEQSPFIRAKRYIPLENVKLLLWLGVDGWVQGVGKKLEKPKLSATLINSFITKPHTHRSYSRFSFKGRAIRFCNNVLRMNNAEVNSDDT